MISTKTYLHTLSKSFKQWLGSIVPPVQAVALPMDVAPPEQGFYGSLIIRTSSGLAPVFTSTVKMFPTPRRIELRLEELRPL
jgi:hypothetical protein